MIICETRRNIWIGIKWRQGNNKRIAILLLQPFIIKTLQPCKDFTSCTSRYCKIENIHHNCLPLYHMIQGDNSMLFLLQLRRQAMLQIQCLCIGDTSSIFSICGFLMLTFFQPRQIIQETMKVLVKNRNIELLIYGKMPHFLPPSSYLLPFFATHFHGSISNMILRTTFGTI